VPSLLVDNVLLTDSSDVSNGFNNYFSTIGEKLVIDLDNKCKLNCDEFKKYLSSSHMNSMFWDLVDSTELSIILSYIL